MNNYVGKLLGMLFQSQQTRQVVHTSVERPSRSAEAWRAHWRAEGIVWRTEPEIDARRQEELRACRAIVPDIAQGVYPFRNMRLSRADVEWLLATHEQGPVDWRDVGQRERRGLDLRGADLRQVNLQGLPLARLRGGLDRNEWITASREQLDMAKLHLEGANLADAHLEGACLTSAQLEGSNLAHAHMEKADLWNAHLEGAYLQSTHLEGASLRGAFFDVASTLREIILNNDEFGAVLLSDVRWAETNLSVVNWSQVKMLGDEQEAKRSIEWSGHVKSKRDWLSGYRRAARANRQLAIALQDEGLNEDAARFAYRAQVLQRKVLWRQRAFGKWLFSLLLAVLAGYGYRMWRILAAYAVIVSFCAVAYFVIGMYHAPHLTLLQALLESITAFHGRVFYELFTPDTPQIWVTAFEAIAGLIVESVFIAMLTQRFFAK